MPRHRCAARSVVASVLGAVACLSSAPALLADGDPASDVLLYQSVFLPYTAPSQAAKADLVSAVRAAAGAGLPVRVAVIQSPQDLGADPELFGKPKAYARFLDSELLSAHYFGILIVVMPQGYGVAGGGRLIDHGRKFKPRPIRGFERALRRFLRSPRTTDVDTLTGAATVAVRVVARTAGHPIPGPIPRPTSDTGPPRSNPDRTSASGLPLEVAVGAAAFAAIALIGLRIRRRRTREPVRDDVS